MGRGVLLVTSSNQAETCKRELDAYKKSWVVVNTGGQITKTAQPEPVTILSNGEVEEHWVLRPKKDALLEYLATFARQGLPFVLAGDGSIESEKIASDISQLVPSSNVRVMILKSLRAKDIIEGIQQAREVDVYRARAAEVRRIIDVLIGYKLSNIMSWHLRQSGYLMPEKLSIGRIMGLGLRILCENQDLINSHVGEKFIRLKCWYRKDEADFKVIDKTRFFKEDLSHLNQMKELKRKLIGNPHVVTHYARKQREESPPEPLHHATLQEACYNYRRFKGTDTLRLARELFEAGYISNYKTNSNQISEEDYEKILVYLYEIIPEDTIIDIKRKYKEYDGVGPGEYAITPTVYAAEYSPKNIMHLWKSKGEVHLHEAHKKVYEIIWYRTLATQVENAFFDTTELGLQISDHRMKIISNKALIGYDEDGKEKVMKGWLALNESLLRGSITMAEESWMGDEIEIPEYELEDEANCVDVTEFESGTEPPKRYGEARFVKTLKKLNVAQPSSLPQLVEGLIGKGFVEHTGAVLKVKKLGQRVDEWVVKHAPFMHDVDSAVKVSETLRMIETGEYPEPEELIRKIYAEISKVADEVGYEDLHKFEKPSQLQIEQARAICRKKRIELNESVFHDREAIELFLRNHGVRDEPVEYVEQTILGRCPKCKEGSIVRRDKFYGCTNYGKSSCDFGLNIEFSKKFFERFGIDDMSDEYLDTIVSGSLGKEYVEVKNMIDKNNTEFTGKVALTQNGKYWNLGFYKNNSDNQKL